MYENIKVIAMDIDGTLDDGSKHITKKTIEVLNKLHQKGYILGLASGRPYENCEFYAEEWGLDWKFDFLVCLNGGELWIEDHQKEYDYLKMEPADLKEIVERMADYASVISMYLPGVYLTTELNDKTINSAYKQRKKLIETHNLADFYREPRGGIMFRVKEEQMAEIEKHFKDNPGENYVAFKTQPDLLEFSHKDLAKSYALEKYCEMMGYTLDECMAFGDTTNDNKMLACCHGVCLLNGSDDTKACAEIITEKPNSENGFAHFVEKYLLKEID